MECGGHAAALHIDAAGRSAAIARRFSARLIRDETLTATVAYCENRDCDSFTLVEAIELGSLSSHGIGAAMFSGIRAAEAIASRDFASYERAVDAMWNGYVSMRRDMCANERRWPESPFWLARYTARS